MATILIIDEPAASRELTALLGHDGHRVFVAADGEEARDIVRAEKPDLVLADILMPESGGFEFVEQLRTEEGLAQPRVVFLSSGYMEAEARALAQELAESATYALALAKKMFHSMYVPTLEQLLEMETLASGLARLTRDHQEGVAAFKEKRPPRFQGR